VLLATIALAGAGCGEIAEVDGLKRPVPRIGRGPEFRFVPAGPAAAAGRPVAGLRCTVAARDRFGAHLEVFVKRLDVVIPAGIGVAGPHRRDGAYVTGGRCHYPARTLEPTGLIEVDAGRELTLGQFFDIWGQPLSRTRLLRYRSSARRPVEAFVDGRRWMGDPRAIPLRRHAAIVLEAGGYFPPSRRYVFPGGL
jgi:hypothetical protein